MRASLLHMSVSVRRSKAVNAHVRIRAGGAGKLASLPRHKVLPTFLREYENWLASRPLQPRPHQQPFPHLHHVPHDRGERALGAVVESDHQLRAAAPHALTPTRLSPA